jgi:hypothetical protein
VGLCLVIHQPVRGAEITFIPAGSTWSFFAGRTEASIPDKTSWRNPDFVDGSWAQRPAVFFYGESGYTGTHLSDMQGSYTSFFLRKTFVVGDPGALSSLYLRALCDDGFVAWINGHYVGSLFPPAGATNYNSVASGLAGEPVNYSSYPLPPPAGYILSGTNVLAVQVFNVSAGSSDILFDGELFAELTPDTPPFVVSVSPMPGLVDGLDQITVVFSEAVTGVRASDLMLNGLGAEQVTGSGTTYVFEFAPASLGGVQATWDPETEIRTVASPVRALDPLAPGMTWAYELLAPAGPVLANVHPPAGLTLRSLSEVAVSFDQAVQGLDAEDLLLNGIPAVEVTGLGAGPYRFRFSAAGAGVATVSWAADHGIAGGGPYAPALEASGWDYQVDPQLALAPVMINEFLAENIQGLADEEGDQVDWVELHNPGTTAASLLGWGLTDDATQPHQWVFPDVTVPAGGHLVVHASGKDRRSTVPGARLHTNFKLGIEGEYLGLFGPDTPARAVSELAPGYPAQRPGYAYARQGNGVWAYEALPTPGIANRVSEITNVMAAVHFNVARCTYNRPFDLWLSCPTPGATIRYALDGSTPTEATGQLYTGPLRMQRTLSVRAAAFKPRHLPSPVATHTYIYFPSALLRRTPVISLVTDAQHLYGPSGIMEYEPRNTTQHGLAWERPVSFEYLTPDGRDDFQVNCGIRVAGGGYVRERYDYDSGQLPWSKYSFRLYFRGDYGPGRLDYPLFPDTTVADFDTITLRAGMNDHSNPFIRDEMVRQLAGDVGQVSSRGTFVTMYLNGRAVGIYNPCERIDDDFLRTYHGGTNAWDVIGSMSELLEGDAIAWNQLRNFINTRDLTTPANYLEAMRRLDLVNFIDYLLPQIYADNDDWPHNNWRAARERVPDGRFRFYVWDAEWAFGYQGNSPTHDTIANQLSTTAPPWGTTEIQSIFNGLKTSSEFRLLFADRVHRHLFNDGALTDERIRARYEEVKQRALPIISNFDDSIGTVWIPQRRPHLLNHLAAAGFLASANAPVFSQFGGRVPSGWELEISAPGGEIYFTTDDTDPRVMFDGSVTSGALLYTGPVRLDQVTRIKARTLNGSTWSALTEALFEVASVGQALAFSEIMYNPPGGDAYEFLELANTGSVAVDLADFALEGLTYRFPVGAAPLGPGQRLVLASGSDPAAFALRYPGLTVAGWFEASLANGGERLTLRDGTGRTVASVSYDDEPPWPITADGHGASLERIRFDGDADDPASWQASAQPGGSPGAANSPEIEPGLVLNEVMAVNLSAVAREGQYPDWIELQNRGDGPVDLSGWSLSDSVEIRRFVFPDSTTMPAGGFLVVWCDTNATQTGLHTGFGLGRRGETLGLYDAAGTRVDVITFGHQVADYSIGRLGSEWALTEPTPGAANEPALSGSVFDLVINEFMANPSPGGDDWLEFYNRDLERPVALKGLLVSAGDDQYQNLALNFIAAGGYVDWIADGESGPDHLDLRLPAAGGELMLRDATGAEIDGIPYGPQVEAVSQGRLPDGGDTWMAFAGTASPGAANHVLGWSGPALNEFMARNVRAVVDPSGRGSDWVELFNPGGTAFDLSGMRLNTRGNEPNAWVFPPNSVLGPGGYLLLWCNDWSAPSTAYATNMNVGTPLRGEGGGVYLFNPGGQLVDAVEYGFQIEDKTVGRSAGSWGLLAEPTPGAANAAPATMGEYSGIRFNEWLAASATGEDWFELHNPSLLPVNLSGLYLTDNPATASQTKHAIGPLTFIAPLGFVRWIADDQPQDGPDHVSFSLDAQGEILRLNTNAVQMVDVLYYGAQLSGVSAGRLPDGNERVVQFPLSASPGSSNYLPLSDLVINELLTHTDPPLEDAIELRNLGSQSIDIGGWYLSGQGPELFRIPPNTIVPGHGYHVFYAQQFNASPGTSNSFALNSAHGDSVQLTEVDATGQATGRRATAVVGPAANGVSLGRIQTSVGVDYAPLVGRSFGMDQPASLIEFRQGKGAENAMPLVGPVIIQEIMFHPAVEGAAEEGFEFLELLNAGATEVALFDAAHPTNTWRLNGEVSFSFPPGSRLESGALLLVVAFDPTVRPDLEAAFRAAYGVPGDIQLVGPYAGSLNNAGGRVELLRPDRPQGPSEPDAGYVPFLGVDRVDYTDHWPWPPEADGLGASLQRRAPHLYGNEPLHWKAAEPTAGRVGSDPGEEDTDQDGMPDTWELENGLDSLDPTDAGRDEDGDWQTNLAEFLAGTDPNDAADVLELRFQVGEFAQQLWFRAMSGRSYSVQYADDLSLGVWLKLTDVYPTDTTRDVLIEIEEPPGGVERWYRVIMPAQP